MYRSWRVKSMSESQMSGIQVKCVCVRACVSGCHLVYVYTDVFQSERDSWEGGLRARMSGSVRLDMSGCIYVIRCQGIWGWTVLDLGQVFGFRGVVRLGVVCMGAWVCVEL